MKRLISVLLVFCLALNSGGIIALYIAAREQVRADMSISIQSGNVRNDAVLLKIPKEILSVGNNIFVRTGKNEIRYKGKMFDIISEQEYNDTLFISCISDEKEDGLNDQYEASFDVSLGDGNKSTKSCIKKCATDTHTDYFPMTNLLSIIDQDHTKYPDHSDIPYNLPDIARLSPPPVF